jgi:alkylation response protein AidB-like acyl-CoA dehydrogenase
MTREIVEAAARLSRETLAPRAAWYDRDGVNPVESWRDLHREGLLAAGVPTTHGGLGLDMPTYRDALHRRARLGKSAATLLRRGRRARQLFGSWGSEPAVSLSRTFLMETAIRDVGDGWIVEGVKHFCTMALGATYYMVWCARDGDGDMGKALMLALVPAEATGIATDGKWNTLGMRGTYSPSVTFTRVRIPRDAVLGGPGSAIQIGVVESFGLGYAAIYVGIAEAALTFAVEYAKQCVTRPDNIAVAQDPAVQRHIGGLDTHLGAARLVVADAAARWETADITERSNLANKAKYLATEVSLEVTSRVIQVVGGRGAYKDYPAERAFRDVRTATLMPPTLDRMLETIGKAALGIQEGMFRTGAGPRGS